MNEIKVGCVMVIDGWRCQVQVSDDVGTSVFDVGVGERGPFLPSILPHPGFDDIDRLVRETFEFLLEREPRTAILPAFDLGVVSRYFPEYPAAIRVRLSR